MSETALSDRETDVVRHALGLTRKEEAYRNYFSADVGSDDDKTWLGLVRKGLAIGVVHGENGRFYRAGMRLANAVKRDGERYDEEVREQLQRIDRNLTALHGDLERG